MGGGGGGVRTLVGHITKGGDRDGTAEGAMGNMKGGGLLQLIVYPHKPSEP